MCVYIYNLIFTESVIEKRCHQPTPVRHCFQISEGVPRFTRACEEFETRWIRKVGREGYTCCRRVESGQPPRPPLHVLSVGLRNHRGDEGSRGVGSSVDAHISQPLLGASASLKVTWSPLRGYLHPKNSYPPCQCSVSA